MRTKPRPWPKHQTMGIFASLHPTVILHVSLSQVFDILCEGITAKNESLCVHPVYIRIPAGISILETC